MRPLKTLLIALLVLAPCASNSEDLKKSGPSIDLNFGLSLSKTILGLSYNSGRNQFVLGFDGLAFSTRDGYFFQPGVVYNRYFTDNGFYATVGYMLSYHNRDIWEPDFSDTTFSGTHVITDKKGWDPGFLFTGLGKSWQFRHWGLHLDGGAITSANENIAREWGFYLGGGASYRFHLN